jgi:hypothetical protein
MAGRGDAPHPVTAAARGSARGNASVPAATSTRGSNVAVVAAVLALLAAGAILSPDGAGQGSALTLFGLPLPTICWFRLTTGLPCPGCGLTRAIALLMHGRVFASLAMHPFGVAAVGLALLQIPPRAVRAAGSSPPWTFRWDRLWAYALVATAILMMSWWILRIGAFGWLGARP